VPLLNCRMTSCWAMELGAVPGSLLGMEPVTATHVQTRAIVPSPSNETHHAARWCRYTQSGQKTAVVDPYVEVRAGAEVFRTPCVHASPAPAWNWDFDLRLPAPLGTQGAVNSLKCVRLASCCASHMMASLCCHSGRHDITCLSSMWHFM
jgi:hypothetical protein